MKHLTKKGQIMQNLGALGVGIVALVLILAIVFLVMAQIKTQTISQESVTGQVLNETVTYVNDTYVALGYTGEAMQIDCSLITSGHDTPVGNFTCSTAGINLQTNHNVSGSKINVSYTYKNISTAYTATETLTNATQTIPGWVPLIILVAIGGIILGLVAAFKPQR